VRDRLADIRSLGAAVLVVVQAAPPVLAVFLRESPWPFDIVADPTLAAYQAFGLGKTTWADILRPASVLRYLRLILQGQRPLRPKEGEDVLQLGGDFILDPAGRLAYAHKSAEPTDRPPVDALLAALSAAS